MIDPNVPSFFLIILCGFGAVWSFRFFSNKQDKKIYEFEYVAFSTLWGSLIFLPVLTTILKYPNLSNTLNLYPFIATPALFVLGWVLGLVAFLIVKGSKILMGMLQK